jgi:excisionase family DNA binding protein
VTELARALLGALDDEALDALAVRLAPRLRNYLTLAPREQLAEDGWMGTEDAARHLGMSRHALYKLTSARRIPFTPDTPGGRCWFRRSELDHWRSAQAR